MEALSSMQIYPMRPYCHGQLRPLPSRRFVYPGSVRSATRNRLCSCYCAAVAVEDSQLQDSKYSLLKAVQETDRGFNASADQRALIEESVVVVEGFDAGVPLDIKTLDGTWMLLYTTASDVLSILQASQLPFLKVGQIFQKFECKGDSNEGIVRNVVRWSVPGVLQDDDGATLTVTAKFYAVSPRNIALEFQEAAVGNIMLSEEFQGLIAPALLPRTYLNLQVLQFIRGFTAKFPLQRREANASRRPPLGLLYYISFVDNTMFIGRALGSGGIFIFSKTQPLQSH